MKKIFYGYRLFFGYRYILLIYYFINSNRRNITEGKYIEKTFEAGVFHGVVVQLTNTFTHYSRELYFHVIYEDGDSEDLSALDVMALMITDPNKIDQAKQKQYVNNDGTISYNEVKGVTYAEGHKPDISVKLLHLPSLKSSELIVRNPNESVTVDLPSLKSSELIVTNPYKTGKLEYVGASRDEVSNKNESVSINQGESVSINQGKSNTVSSANTESNSDKTNVGASTGSNDSKSFRLDMGKFQNQMEGGPVAQSIKYSQSAAFQSTDQSIYRVVFIQLPNVLWYFKVGFMKMVLENIFNGDVPLWVSSMKDIFIRKQPHGLNQLSRKKKNNGDMGYPKTIIAFTHKVTRAASTLESHSLNAAIAKIHTIFTNTEGLNGALHSWSMANQAGVITFFNNKEPSTQKILEKFDKDIKTVFKSKRIINTNTALDKYMLDWDIKQFVANDLGYSHWPHEKISSIFGGANSGSNVPDFDNVQELTLND